jgi:hypothetical protein
LITDDPITVIFNDGKVVSGISQKASFNMMQLETEKGEAPFAFKLSEVAAINPGKKPVVKITARLNVGLTQERGNTDKDRFRLDGEFVARTEKNRYTLLGEFKADIVIFSPRNGFYMPRDCLNMTSLRIWIYAQL